MHQVTAHACCRVDLAGGTLDIWPLGLLFSHAATVNVAIDVAATVRLGRSAAGYTLRREGEEFHAGSLAELAAHPHGSLVGVVGEACGLPPCVVELASGSPRGGGLGASSALAVALIAATEELLGHPPSPAGRRAALARDLEARMMELPTGLQDHYPALLGGALEIRHAAGGEAVRRLAVDLEALGRALMVVYSGESHFSAGSNWQVVRRLLDGDRRSRRALAAIAAVTAELAEALERGELEAVGRCMSREWEHRRKLAEGISTPTVERLLTVAAAEGAWGGKVCGAGGGGSIALLVPAERRAAIAEALRDAGGQVLAAHPSGEPLRVEVDGREGGRGDGPDA